MRDYEEKRAAQMTTIADENSRHLQLIDFQEEGPLGRYFLRPSFRGGYSWAEVVVLRYGNLLVHGDCDLALFSGYHKPTSPRQVIDWMATNNYDYATEKASIGGSRARVWDEYHARAAVLSWRRRKDIGKETADDLWQAANEDEHSFFTELHRHNLYEAQVHHVTSMNVFGAQAVLRRLKLLLPAEVPRTIGDIAP